VRAHLTRWLKLMGGRIDDGGRGSAMELAASSTRRDVPVSYSTLD
jgi:hypothetical protein